jgi:hypothetical protein
MSTPIDRLLARLEAVHQVGPGRWIARCPAHEDRRPSLSVRETADGCVLVYDFAGCGAADVLGAVELDFADLYPEGLRRGPRDDAPRRAPGIPAADALHLLDEEALTVEVIAYRVACGESVEQHRRDLLLAANRIAAIRSAWEAAP